MTWVFAKDDTGDMTVENPFRPPVVVSAVDPEDMVAEGGSLDDEERPYTPAEGLDPEAPYGYTIDRKTGEKRPRKRAGRGVRVVKVEEPPPAAGAPKAAREPDRVPGRVKPEEKTRRTRTPRATKPEPEPLPVFRAGPIAKAVNKLYLRAGKLVRAMDYDIGTAIIAATRAETEDDVTVGEAWEEVARTNPRIRRVLLKLIEGGAWTQLFMAHAPILLAVLLKERIARHLPMMGLLSSFLSDDEEEQSAGGPGLFAGLTQEDMQQAMNMFNSTMGTMTPPMPDWPSTPMRQPMPSRAAVYEDLPLPGDDDASA